MRLVEKVVEYTGDKVFTLRPLGDVHIGTIHHDRQHWLRDVQAVQNDPNALWIGMGDYCESIVLSDPRFEPSEIAPQFRDKLGNLAVAQSEQFIEDTNAIADKCIGLIEGNHEYENRKRHYVDTVLNACKELDAPYLGDTAMIRLVFRRVDEDGKPQRSDSFVIYAEHGHGGGRKTGGKINSLEDIMAAFDADIYLRGHVHDLVATKKPRLTLNFKGKPSLLQRNRICGLTGCYYKTYEENTSSYGERKGYHPTQLGSLAIRIRPITREMEVLS